MHSPISKPEPGILETLVQMFKSFWSGISPNKRVQALQIQQTGAKRWSSSTLTKAPNRLKPASHLKYAKQQKTCQPAEDSLDRQELEDMVREGVCLDGTYLAFADFSCAFLSYGRFRGSNLAGANLARSIVIGGNFMDANLRNACLVSADLRHCNFHCADLSGANLRGANLSGADLSGANLWGADLFGANLEGALLSGSIWNPPCV